MPAVSVELTDEEIEQKRIEYGIPKWLPRHILVKKIFDRVLEPTKKFKK